MIIKRWLFKSKLFQQFLDQGFWHAHHVDLVWRFNGQDVHEEADWLKDVWYALRDRPDRIAVPSDYSKPHDWCTFDESDDGSPLMVLKFRDLPSLTIGVSHLPEDKRDWFSNSLHRQIANIAAHAANTARADIQEQIKDTLGLK